MNTHFRFVCASVVALAAVMLMAAASQGQPFRGGGQRPRGPGGESILRLIPVMKALDADQDGKISAKEIENAPKALRGLDKDKNGELTEDELAPSIGGPGMGSGGFQRRSGFGDAQGSSGSSFRRGPNSSALKVGNPAPDFELPVLVPGLDAENKATGTITDEKVKLSSLRGKKVVCLFLTSYT